jgi:L-rhamnose mutarotase
MQRIGFTMKIKPEFREEYLALHENVDSPLIEEYRRLGVQDYVIYISTDGHLFASMVCEDWSAFTSAVENSPNQAAWAKKVYHMFEIKPDEPGGMVTLTEAFHMDREKP